MMRGLREVRTEVVLEREKEVRRKEGGKSARNSFILASSRRHRCVWPPESRGKGEEGGLMREVGGGGSFGSEEGRGRRVL